MSFEDMHNNKLQTTLYLDKDNALQKPGKKLLIHLPYPKIVFLVVLKACNAMYWPRDAGISL